MTGHVDLPSPEDSIPGLAPPSWTDDPLSFLTEVTSRIDQLVDFLLRQMNINQLVIAVVILGIAHILRLFLAPRYRAWLRNREGWPLRRMRYALVIEKRMRLILFVLLIWAVVLVMREITWPSRSYMLSIIARLATAWLVVALITRLIENSLFRAIVRYGAWTWVTLSILNLTADTQRLLSSLAIDIGETRVSVWTLLQAAVFLGAAFVIARMFTRATTTRIKQNEDISPSMQVLAVKALQLLFYGAAFFIGLRFVGFDLTGLAFLSGAIGLGLGFGLQKVVSNLVSGIIILLDKSIKPGDVISLGETFGWINSLGARYVSVVTRDGKEYLIPNEDLITNQVVNWSHSNEFVRLDIHFGTSYSNNPHEVRRIAIEAAQGVDRVLSIRPTVCHVVGFGDSSVDYVLRFWIQDPTGGLTNIRGQVFLALWDAFEANGISIPFPQREVKVIDPVSVQSGPAGA